MSNFARPAVSALAGALWACATPDPLVDITREPPSIRGTITLVQPGAQRNTVRIEERPDQSAGDQKAVVTLTPATLLYERKDTSLS